MVAIPYRFDPDHRHQTPFLTGFYFLKKSEETYNFFPRSLARRLPIVYNIFIKRKENVQLKPDEVLAFNLSYENKEAPSFFERRAAHIANACELLLPTKLPESDERLGVLADVGHEFLNLLNQAETVDEAVHPIHKNEIFSLSRSLKDMDTVMFARRAEQRLFKNGIDLFKEKAALEGSIRIAYVRNKISDEAFRRILSTHEATPIYVDSFRVAAEMVSEGDAEACLLPCETGNGYRIRAAFELADELRLRIYGVENIPDGEGEARLLLLSSRAISLKDMPRYMTLRFSPSAYPSLAMILRAAEHFGLSVFRFYTDIEASERETFLMTAVLKENAAPRAFLAYLYLFSGSVQFYGIY